MYSLHMYWWNALHWTGVTGIMLALSILLSNNWHQERVAFDCFQMLGYLTIYTDRCNKRKLCTSILTLVKLKTSAVLHGLLYEAVARQTCNARIGLKIQTCGLFIRSEYNYLAASPACVVGKAAKPEITCPFNARNSKTAAYFFSVSIWNRISYHMQAQGQLNVCKAVFLCYLFVLGHMCY